MKYYLIWEMVDGDGEVVDYQMVDSHTANSIEDCLKETGWQGSDAKENEQYCVEEDFGDMYEPLYYYPFGYAKQKKQKEDKEKTMKRFNITFKDPNYEDWHMILHTSEDKTSEEINDIITTYAEIVSNGILGDDYSPVTILDRLCDDMQDEGRDWYWTDPDEDVVIDIW